MELDGIMGTKQRITVRGYTSNISVVYASRKKMAKVHWKARILTYGCVGTFTNTCSLSLSLSLSLHLPLSLSLGVSLFLEGQSQM